mgnify:CR=1 FL=1
MNNILNIDGYKAVISFDPETEMFRGEFVDLNGGADFYATDVATLKEEAKTSLRIFLEECERRGIEPKKQFSGKFVLRVSPETHQAAALAARASGVSLNQWAANVIAEAAAI